MATDLQKLHHGLGKDAKWILKSVLGKSSFNKVQDWNEILKKIQASQKDGDVGRYTKVMGKDKYDTVQKEIEQYVKQSNQLLGRIEMGIDSDGTAPSAGQTDSDKKIGTLLGTPSKTERMMGTLRDLRVQGASYINMKTQAAANNAYVQKEKLLETQRRYGITGGVAAAQMQQHELDTTKAIAQIQNQASIEWWKTAGAQMAQYDVMQDRKNQGFIQGLAQKVSDGEDVAGIIDATQASDTDGTYDWDTIGVLKDMTQDEANTFMDLFKYGAMTGQTNSQNKK